MIGAKAMHGKKVRLLRDLETNGGLLFRAGEVLTFSRDGTVRTSLRHEDGRRIIDVDRGDFELVESLPIRLTKSQENVLALGFMALEHGRSLHLSGSWKRAADALVRLNLGKVIDGYFEINEDGRRRHGAGM